MYRRCQPDKIILCFRQHFSVANSSGLGVDFVFGPDYHGEAPWVY